MGAIAAVVASVLLSVSPAVAQTRSEAAAGTLVPLDLRNLERVWVVTPVSTREPAIQTPAPRPQRSIRRKVFGGVIGAVVGFFAGGVIGAKIEGPCQCDDPGLKGAVIGAPIGAITLGIIGVKLF